MDSFPINPLPKIDFMEINQGRRTDLGYADILYQRLIEQIKDFEKELDPEHEVGAYLAAFGREILMRIERVGFHNPFFIVFYGLIEQGGQRVQLVQHVHQLSVLFVALPKLTTNITAHRVGFDTSSITRACP